MAGEGLAAVDLGRGGKFCIEREPLDSERVWLVATVEWELAEEEEGKDDMDDEDAWLCCADMAGAAAAEEDCDRPGCAPLGPSPTGVSPRRYGWKPCPAPASRPSTLPGGVGYPCPDFGSIAPGGKDGLERTPRWYWCGRDGLGEGG